MEFSIVIPTHNESARIGRTLRLLAAFLKRGRRAWEIVVVDDGKDDTAKKARQFPRTRVLHYPKRLGKGGAVMEGFKRSRGKTVLMYDADAATPPSEIPRLLAALKTADVAIGCRYCFGSRAEMPFLRRVTGKGFNLAVRLLFGLPFRDTQCGFKAARRAAILPLLGGIREKGFVWDAAFLRACTRGGLRIAQIPIRWRHVPGGTADAGGALGVLRTSARMLFALLRLRLS